jgi:hypothetical protein
VFAGLRLVVLVCASLLAASAPTSRAAANATIKDPSSIACPSSPSGWFFPAAAGKKVEDAQTDVRLHSSYQVLVTCNYFTRAGKHILVQVDYTLPTDPNPKNDFAFLGCGSGGTQWNATDRVFRLISADQWAFAGFYDSGLQLEKSDVPRFEDVARQLLHNSEGYGHSCALTVKPTPAVSNLSFVFQVSAGQAAGSFVAQAIPGSKVDAVPVVQVHVPNITLKVKTNGASHGLTIRVKRGIDYHPATQSSNGTVRFAIEVVHSKVPSCPQGAAGRLTVSTKPSVLLDVCGQTFLRGKAEATISFVN